MIYDIIPTKHHALWLSLNYSGRGGTKDIIDVVYF